VWLRLVVVLLVVLVVTLMLSRGVADRWDPYEMEQHQRCWVLLLQVRPLEDQFKFGSFFTPLLHESDFEAKPSVLLLGQYSTGTVVYGASCLTPTLLQFPAGSFSLLDFC
jgi:hypothetical protein